MRWQPLLSVALVASALAACAATVQPQSGEPLPSHGDPGMAVAYRVTLYCSIDFAIGDTWWRFVDPTKWPKSPPPGIFDDVTEPAPVPGVVLLSSAEQAVFRADVDRSVRALVRVDVPDEAACL